MFDNSSNVSVNEVENIYRLGMHKMFKASIYIMFSETGQSRVLFKIPL